MRCDQCNWNFENKCICEDEEVHFRDIVSQLFIVQELEVKAWAFLLYSHQTIDIGIDLLIQEIVTEFEVYEVFNSELERGLNTKLSGVKSSGTSSVNAKYVKWLVETLAFQVESVVIQLI